jgi:hypothetical protein
MKHNISTSITINADIETVWKIFTNFDDYPNWNPLIKSITGPVVVGQRFTAVIQNTTFKPMVKVFNAEEELTWQGKLFIRGIFDGRHSFIFKSLENGKTTLIQKEEFGGILIPFVKKKLNTDIVDAFNAMNEKLKELAEKE